MKEIGDRIKAIRDLLQLKQEPFAKLVGTTQATVSRWEKGAIEPSDEHIAEIARIASPRRSRAWIKYGGNFKVHDPETIPVAGYVRGGEEVVLTARNNRQEVVTVRLPPNLSAEGLLALRVQDNTSLRPLKRGAVIYYRARERGVAPDCIDELCVVGLRTGRTLIKQVIPGAAQGTYTLLSWGGGDEPLRDQAVVWAAPVLNIDPKG